MSHKIRHDNIISIGDSVVIDNKIWGIVVGVPQATGDAWKIRTGNTVYDLIYVQQYNTMQRIVPLTHIAWLEESNG